MAREQRLGSQTPYILDEWASNAEAQWQSHWTAGITRYQNPIGMWLGLGRTRQVGVALPLSPEHTARPNTSGRVVSLQRTEEMEHASTHQQNVNLRITIGTQGEHPTRFHIAQSFRTFV